MNLQRDPNINEFLDTVCAQVKCREVHSALKTELLNHMEDRIEDLTGKGIPIKEAIPQAIKDMGDPVSIGIQLAHTHRPKIHWRLIIVTLLFLGFGLFTLYTIQANHLLRHEIQVFYKSAFYALLGAMLLILVSRLDYRKLWPLSPYIYLITLVIWLYALISGPTVAGLPYLLIGPWAINLGAVTPYFLIAASAGLLLKCDWNDRKSYLISGALFIIPLMLYLASSCLSGLLLFGGAFLVLVWRSGGKKLHISLLMALLLIPAVLKIIAQPYRLERITGFLNPQADPGGAGYLYLQLDQAIRSAGLLGHGFNLSALPELHTDFVFAYIVYSFGWLAAMLLLMLVLGFFIYLFGTVKQANHEYGSLLIAGLATLLLIQSLWHIFMNLGWLPVTGMSLPFISYGGSQLLVQMLVLGIILSVYRLKDMVLLCETI